MADLVDFNKLVDEIITGNNLVANRPVVEKELLHYDILYALSAAGLLKKITFQGGTSLRLCYNSNRFSEDLDFAGGSDFCSVQMEEIKHCIEKYVGERYGLDVIVKEPKELRQEPDYTEVKVDKWQISVTTSPEKKDLPRQCIKIEIANIPAYTKAPRMLMRNYTYLPDGYSDFFIQVEELNEVMADKLVSFPATTNRIRYRDMWDLAWLKQNNAIPDAELVMKKIIDYKINERFQELLQKRINSLAEITQSSEFINEMKRFLPVDVVARTFGTPDFISYLYSTLLEMLTVLQSDIYGGDTSSNKQIFNM